MDQEVTYWRSFFKRCGVPQFECTVYTKYFLENRIQRSMLHQLTREYLKDMGISRVGDIIAILSQADIAYQDYLKEADKDKKEQSSSQTNVSVRKNISQPQDDGVAVDQLPNLLFEPEIEAKLSREKELIAMTYPDINKDSDTGGTQPKIMKSLISTETRSRINRYLDSQVVKNTSSSKKYKSATSTKGASPKRGDQMNSASLLRDMLIEGRKIAKGKDVAMGEEGNHGDEEEQLLEEHQVIDGATGEYDEHMIDVHLEEVVTSEMEAARLGHAEEDQEKIIENPDNLGLEYLVEEVVTETAAVPKSQTDKVVSLYSVDCIRSDMPSTSGMVTPSKKRVRKKRVRPFDVMIAESKEMEDLRYDIGRSLLSLKNSRVKPDGEEAPKRILGVNYKKRREAARLKHRTKLPVIWSSTRTHDDHSVWSKQRSPSPKTEMERLSKIKSIRGISAKEAQSLLAGKRDRETSKAVESIVSSPESSTDTIENTEQKGKTKMAADSTNSPHESAASGSSPDGEDDSDKDMDGVILEMDCEEDDEESDDKIEMESTCHLDGIFTLPTLDMKNLSKYQYRDIIPVLLKLTTKCDKIKPDWWPHGMIWCVKRNIYDQPNISLEALYKVVRSCYEYYNQTSSLINEPSFESLEDLDHKQFKKAEKSPQFEGMWKAAKGSKPAEATGSPSQPSSDVTVSTSTPDAGLEPMFKCTFCEEYFTKDDLKIHVKKHSGDKPYKCDYCDKSFSGKGPQQSHMRIHQRTQHFKCDICEATFEEKFRLNRHIRLHCKDAEYRCVFCDQVFDEDQHLQTHLRIHAGEKPYKCELCKKTFSYSSNYKVHMRLHTGDKPYKCNQCNARFRQLHSLKTHMSSHTGIKPFRCGLCDKQFQYKRSLQLHFKLHAAIFEIEQMHAEDIPGRCDNCKMLFTAKMDMLRRVRISSTSTLPYGCRECNMSFLKAEELKTHFRIHAKESTLGCEQCKLKNVSV